MKRKLLFIPAFSFFALSPSLLVESCSKKPNPFNINNYINFNSVRYEAIKGKPTLQSVVDILAAQVINYSYKVVASDTPESNQIGVNSFSFDLNNGIQIGIKLKSTPEDGNKNIELKNVHIKMVYDMPHGDEKNIDGYKVFIKSIEGYLLKNNLLDNDDISNNDNYNKTQSNLNESIRRALNEVWSSDKKNNMGWIAAEIKDKDKFASISNLEIKSYAHASNGLTNKTIEKYGLTKDDSKDYVLKTASFDLAISDGNFEINKFDDNGKSNINVFNFNNSMSTIEQKAEEIHLDKNLNEDDLKNNVTFSWEYNRANEGDDTTTNIYNQFTAFLKDGFYKDGGDDFNFNWKDIFSKNDIELSVNSKSIKIENTNGSKEKTAQLIKDFNTFFIDNADKSEKDEYIFNNKVSVSIKISKNDDNGLSGTLTFGIWIVSIIKDDKN